MSTAPRTSLVLLGLALAGAAAAAVLPPPPDPAAVWGAAWLPVGAALLLVLGPALWRRRGALGSARAAGGWTMHAGIAVAIAAGGWMGLAARTGSLEAIEGQLVEIPGTGSVLRLVKLHPALHEAGRARGEAADVEVIDAGGGTRTARIRVNRPLRLGSTSVMLAGHGYAPLLTAAPASGGRGDGTATFVSLETAFVPVVRYWRRLAVVPGTTLPATLVFRPAPRGPYPRDPRLAIVLDPPRGGPVALALTPGRPIVAAGTRFALGEIRRWGGFAVRHEPGLRLVFAGCWIAIAGAAWSALAGRSRDRG